MNEIIDILNDVIVEQINNPSLPLNDFRQLRVAYFKAVNIKSEVNDILWDLEPESLNIFTSSRLNKLNRIIND